MGIRALISKVAKSRTEIPKIAAEKLDEGEVLSLVSEAMDEWYGSYGPMTYNRTYGLHSGVIGGTTYEFTGKDIIVRVDSGSVPMGTHDDGEYRFNGAFLNGIHGTSAIAVSTPPPEIYEPKLFELADEKLNEAAEEYWSTL